MSDIPWFRREPERTATGYRWLDWLTTPYWRFAGWWTERRFWKMLRVGDESIRETKEWVRAVWNAPTRPSLEELLDYVDREEPYE